jgi:8-oxo-dGTP pyrophosphatase MutT (NUDIX family)
VRVRSSARLVVLDAQDRILLFQIQVEGISSVNNPNEDPFWITPGGGVEEGESFEECALRELWEETGIDNIELGPWIWTREIVLSWLDQEAFLSHERFFLVRVKTPKIVLDNFTELEWDDYESHKWWSVEKLKDSDEIIAPPRLAELLESIIAGERSESPIFLDR